MTASYVPCSLHNGRDDKTRKLEADKGKHERSLSTNSLATIVCYYTFRRERERERERESGRERKREEKGRERERE